jgi:hypothetical protein
LQCSVVGFSLNFDVAVRKISNKTLHAEPLCRASREITVADTLNVSANKITFRSRHGQPAIASFALFQAVMPPTTFETLLKPNCSSRLDAMDDL